MLLKQVQLRESWIKFAKERNVLYNRGTVVAEKAEREEVI